MKEKMSMPKSKSTDSCMNNHLETLLVPHGTRLSEAWSAWRSCLLVKNYTHFQGRAGLYGYCSTAIIGLIFVIFPFLYYFAGRLFIPVLLLTIVCFATLMLMILWEDFSILLVLSLCFLFHF